MDAELAVGQELDLIEAAVCRGHLILAADVLLQDVPLQLERAAGEPLRLDALPRSSVSARISPTAKALLEPIPARAGRSP